MPKLFIIAGQNGAGKSSYGKNLLPNSAQYLPIFDGNKVFAKKRDELFKSIKVAKYARQEANEFTNAEFIRLSGQAIANHEDFAYEGHFSSEGPWETIRKFRGVGYETTMVFLGLENVVLSENRVRKRVEKGGFQVSAIEIHYNYYGNLQFLNRYADLLDNLILFDASASPLSVVAHVSKGQSLYQIATPPVWFEKYLPNLVK